jgi:hypothetical protein
MTKAELQKHGEKLAEEYSYTSGSNGINDAGEPPSINKNEYDACVYSFNQALELLFPLVEALELCHRRMKYTAWTEEECFHLTEKALAELEKKVRGE